MRQHPPHAPAGEDGVATALSCRRRVRRCRALCKRDHGRRGQTERGKVERAGGVRQTGSSGRARQPGARSLPGSSPWRAATPTALQPDSISQAGLGRWTQFSGPGPHLVASGAGCCLLRGRCLGSCAVVCCLSAKCRSQIKLKFGARAHPRGGRMAMAIGSAPVLSIRFKSCIV